MIQLDRRNGLSGTQAAATPGDREIAGTAAIEFAICVPFLLVLLMGVVEVGFAAYRSMQVQNSVEAGMLYASKNGWDAAGISAAVVNATGTTGITATPAPVQFCGCPSAAGVVANVCTSTCPGGGSPGQYVRISAAVAHQVILPFPGLPVPATLTANSILRMK